MSAINAKKGANGSINPALKLTKDDLLLSANYQRLAESRSPSPCPDSQYQLGGPRSYGDLSQASGVTTLPKDEADDVTDVSVSKTSDVTDGGNGASASGGGGVNAGGGVSGGVGNSYADKNADGGDGGGGRGGGGECDGRDDGSGSSETSFNTSSPVAQTRITVDEV